MERLGDIMNEILFAVTILVNFVALILIYKFFRKEGVFVWISFATIIANIEVVKCINLFGFALTLGNVIYGTTFLATDILSEMYGAKEARKGVLIGFFTMLVFTLISQINLLYIPNTNDFSSEAMKTIFSLMPRLCIASMITYLISNNLDTLIYSYIKRKSNKFMWIRNNLSTSISQLLDSFLFTIIAFAGVYSLEIIIQLSLTTFFVKVIIAICDTPFLYLAKRIYKKDMEVKYDP